MFFYTMKKGCACAALFHCCMRSIGYAALADNAECALGCSLKCFFWIGLCDILWNKLH